MEAILFKYSIAFIPPPEIIELLDSMKEELFYKAKWFHSRNSKAHITIAEFLATEEQLKKVISKIQETADSLSPFDVAFDHFDFFPNGAFYVAPDAASKDKLAALMKRFHQAIKTISPANRIAKSDNPHLTIGRQLDELQLKTAKEIFQEIRFSYQCKSVSIRVFNENRRQYDISESYPFNGNPSEETVQTSLF